MVLSKKKIGTREEVYNLVANKTSGGMQRPDIIKNNKKKGRRYISRKISERMKTNSNLKKKKKRTIISNCNNTSKTKKNITFNTDNNKVKEYYCLNLELSNIDSDEEIINEFCLDELEEIDLDHLHN